MEMEIIRDYEKELTLESFLKGLSEEQAEMYEEDAEELFEIMEEKDALHPALVSRRVLITDVTEDAVYLDGIPFRSKKLIKEAKAGDCVYVMLVTAGQSLHELERDLSDPILSGVLDLVMNRCLADGYTVVTKRMLQSESGNHMVMAAPGVTADCPLTEQNALLKLLGESVSELGVTILPGGLLRPMYTVTGIFYLTEGERNIPDDLLDEQEREAYYRRLNRESGHN